MARYAAQNKVNNPDNLKQFNLDGYKFNLENSTELDWVFTRKTDS